MIKSEILNKVKETLKSKRSPDYWAGRLNITPAEYRYYRKQVRLQDISIETHTEEPKPATEKLTESSYNLDKGTGHLEMVSPEPLSPAQIEAKFKIDKDNWKLVQYWNKEKPGGGYYVSANIVQTKPTPIETIKSVLDNFDFDYNLPNTRIYSRSVTKPGVAILSMQDLHVGKDSIDKLDTIEKDFKLVLNELMTIATSNFRLDKIIFVLGGDLLNMDTYEGTTTAGTPVANSSDSYSAYKIAFELMFWAISQLALYCDELEVVYIPGNHSRLTEAHIAYALSRCIVSNKIKWNIDYAERKVVTYGKNFFAFEHGDFDTKKSPLTLATEFPKEWGATTFRTMYTGHYHTKRTTEYITENEINGFTSKILPSLSRVDQYHYSNKWTGNKRGGLIEIYSQENGLAATFPLYLN